MRVLSNLCIFLVFLWAFVAVQCKKDCAARLQACEGKNPLVRRPVCGSNNQTYQNRCALLRAQCHHKHNVTVKHKGRCREKQPCWKEQSQKNSGYTPQCRPDGRYAPVQCHEGAGFCWCVTPMGKAIPNTSVAHAKPKCPEREKARKKGNNARNQRKGCDSPNRALFVNNLVQIFRTEYNREISSNSNYSKENPPSKESLKQEAIRWKFSVLDVDKNKSLSKSEFRNLRKLVKKVVKPRRCAKSFIPLCDENRDSQITQDEWIKCLSFGLETIKREDGKSNSSTTQDKTKFYDDERKEIDRPKTSDEVDPEEEEMVGEEDEDSEEPILPLESDSDSDPMDVLQGGTGFLGSLPGDETMDRKEDIETSGCLYDRQTALEEVEVRPETLNYVPECTPDGRYKKVQCYKSKGYCWCAHEDTGKTISGTAVYNQNPTCDTIQPPPRPMKGCPEAKKVVFLKDITQIFKDMLISQKSSNASDSSLGNDEQVLTSYFQYLDKSKNKLLERTEWKPLRMMMAADSRLARCGRRLNKHCDINQDNRISLTEWLACLRYSPQTSQQEMSTIIPHSLKRKGPNPVIKYLKE